MSAIIITIGDEILNGQTVDTNSSWITQQLTSAGVDVLRHHSIADDLNEIVQTILTALEKASLVLCTGGLGPTKDDITKKAIVQALDDELIFSEEMYQRIEKLLSKRGIEVTESHKSQCWVPKSAVLLPNRLGTAPGLLIHNNSKKLLSMPGVPYEMKAIMEDHLGTIIGQENISSVIRRTLYTVGMAESSIEKQIEPVLDLDKVKMAYLPSPGSVRLRLEVDGSKIQNANTVLDTSEQNIRNLLGDNVLPSGYEDIISDIGRILIENKKTLITAESCTGGAIAKSIVSKSGVSAFFVGSVIAYANDIKTDVLGVASDTLKTDGAVSQAVVEEMLQQSLIKLSADYGIAVSGIAGPTGGSADKPVGTVWISVGNRDHRESRRFLFGKDRRMNIEFARSYSLYLLRKFLLKTIG